MFIWCTWKKFLVGIYWIAKHLFVFIGSCQWVDCFMTRCVIREPDDIARFLQWKLRNVFQITRENEWMRAISFCCHIDGMHDGKLRIGVTMYILGKVSGERQLKSAKSFHPCNSKLRVYCFNTAFPRSNCFKKSSY